MDTSLNRRDFLAGSTALLGAGALPLVPRRGTLKIGLVGCGGRGNGALAQALRADRDTVVWAIGDAFEDRVKATMQHVPKDLGKDGASRFECPPERQFVGFDAYKKVIDSGVDVVLLVTPPGFRPAQFEYAVEQKKHVFLEKPVAVDSTGVRRVRAAADKAKAAGLSVVCGFCWRFDTRMRQVFDKINGGAIGEVVSVHTTYHTGTLTPRIRQPGWSDMEWQLRNWWHFTWLSGDHVVEQAVHSIDRLLWATGERLPKSCIALGGRAARDAKKQAEQGHVYDHFTAIYEYEDGKRTFHTCRQIDGCVNDNTDYVHGTQGSAAIDGWSPPHVLKDKAGAVIFTTAKDAKGMYQQEHDELFAGIRSGQPLWLGDKMCNSTLMAIMARLAAYTGRSVTWEQALNSQEDLVPKELAFGPLAVAPVAVPGVTKLT